jgi:GNAT superfamily N-acetyltransferase
MTNSVEQMQAKKKQFITGFVAIDHSTGQIASYATWFFAYYTWVDKSLYIDDLYVKPDYRGNNIGTKLINEVISHAKRENCKRLRWQVSIWNESAKKFYEKLGAVIEVDEAYCHILFGKKG